MPSRRVPRFDRDELGWKGNARGTGWFAQKADIEDERQMVGGTPRQRRPQHLAPLDLHTAANKRMIEGKEGPSRRKGRRRACALHRAREPPIGPGHWQRVEIADEDGRAVAAG